LRGLPPEVGVLAAVGFAVALGFGIVAPALPVYARSFGVSRAAAAAVVSVFALVRLVCAPLAGWLADRFGERRVLTAGIGIVAVSSALAGLASSYGQLVALRGFGGLGSAMFVVSGLTALLRTVPAASRARAAGLYSGGFLLGGITGPALGGLVAGFSYRLPFFIYAGTLAVAGGLGLRLLPRRPVTAASGPRPGALRGIVAGLRAPAYRAAVAANLADNWASVGIRSALVPLFVVDSLHRSTLIVGAGFVVVAALNGLMLLPAGRVADSVGRRPVLIVGLCLSSASLVLLAVGGGLAGYFTSMAVLGLGSGLLDVAPAAVVGDIAGEHGGPLVAGYQMSGDVGSVAGPVAAGALADAASYPVAFAASAAVVALAAVLAVVAPETFEGRPAEPPGGPAPSSGG
jgi:DHA1 family multidrug resistance protein-like MFS transporter